ncbi:MAG: tRNA (adenosine(37)-N6)-threonylcarbamoyltransferase complex transferase subunit TsaD [Candidatus Solibacter sp.]|nr:tRNA (adenosine(37)-N6)-threonylcarbamoyltransferase complex transferase subunit TsaD [Candidatus Solibacter sp.]
MPNLILGIESSCDETAASVVCSGRGILSSVVASQIGTHRKYGGVVPELASREHLRAIVPAVREALERAGAGYGSLSAVAVTEGPGLVGSLLVGLTFAKAICAARGLPLIGVNHIEGHIHAVLIEASAAGTEIAFPALALVASGGHTHLFELPIEGRYRLMGKTRDDAAGEAYDKVAKLLGFGYPGGPLLDALAPHGDANAIRLPFSKMKGNALDFSFSGLKTAMLRWVESRGMEAEIAVRREMLRAARHPTTGEWLAATPAGTLNAIAAFQRVVIEELLRRLDRAAEESGAKAIIVSGGVACNQGLRRAAAGGRFRCPVYFPTPGLSTDNAAMIAAAAQGKFNRGEFADLTLKAKAGLTLA